MRPDVKKWLAQLTEDQYEKLSIFTITSYWTGTNKGYPQPIIEYLNEGGTVPTNVQQFLGLMVSDVS